MHTELSNSCNNLAPEMSVLLDFRYLHFSLK